MEIDLTETERKFLVTSMEFKNEAFDKSRIVQGFLSTDPQRTVRIRINGKKGFLTIKGGSNKSGLTRFEWEKEIELNEAEHLLKLCLPGKIEKIRHLVKVDNHIFEVDEFLDENHGLIIAEIELKDEKEMFTKPSWLGKEVTGETKFYNSQLSMNPYNSWKNEIL